jgi:hypothetical protein
MMSAIGAITAFAMSRFVIVTLAEFVVVMYPGAEISHHTVIEPTSVNVGTSVDQSLVGLVVPNEPYAYLYAIPAISEVTAIPCAAPSYLLEQLVTVTSPGANGTSLPVTTNVAVSTAPATPFV